MFKGVSIGLPMKLGRARFLTKRKSIKMKNVENKNVRP